jgi:NADH-quinone oxidoreductase subunit C
MDAQGIYNRLEAAFQSRLVARDFEAIDPWIEIKPEGLFDACRFLQQEHDLKFDMLNCITAVDYCEPDEKKAAQVKWQPHLELLYHLSSTVHRHRIVLKVGLPRWKDDRPGELPEVQSVSQIWSTAEWHEREVFDLSGVRFLGNPDLRRILCPEDWQGHPLRKDYQQPSEYHGIPTR